MLVSRRAEDELEKVAAARQGSIVLFVRHLRQSPARVSSPWPERSALSRLDRGGPNTSAAHARLDQISPQSVQLGDGEGQGRGVQHLHHAHGHGASTDVDPDQ